MKRDVHSSPRAESREAWKAWQPTVGGPSEATDGASALSPWRESGTRPAHLVLTNDAGQREDVLLGVVGRLAERAGASIRVAHLYNPPPMGDLGMIGGLTPTGATSAVADVFHRVCRAARSLANRTGLPVSPELLVGPSYPTLTEYVRSNAFDLVTVSTGNTWLSLWRGGPWLEISRRRPVLAVGPGINESWAHGPSPTGGVLAVLDETMADRESLAPAVALCRLLDTRLTLLRVRPTNGAWDSADRCHRYLLDVGRIVHPHVPAVRTIMATGRAADAVLNVQRLTGAIVSLAAPTRSWLASFTPGGLGVRILRGSTAPVVFYRPSL